MSSKRKSDAELPAGKRGRKMEVDEDFDSDSDSSGTKERDGLDASKLPEKFLKTFDRKPGKLMISGMVTWELTGRHDPEGEVTTNRPNLYTFHRFTDETVIQIFE